jgi:hypothetical protein
MGCLVVRGTPIPNTDFTGGINTKAAPYLVAQNEARDARNVVSTVRGSVKKRNGNLSFCTSFTGSPANLMSLFPMQTTTVLITTGGTKIYSISTGGVSTDITGGASLTTGLRWEFIEAPASGGLGPLWGMNGTDTPKHWTGAGNIGDWTATVGAVPNGTMCLYLRNRVFVAGVGANPNRLYFSNIGNPRDWPVANVVDFDPSDGDAITGLGTAGSYLLVFKRSKTYVVTDLDIGTNRMVSSTTGCVAHRSISESPMGTFFLTADKGVMVTNGQTLKQLSLNITPTLDGIVAAQRQNACGSFFNDHYYLSVCTSGSTNNITLDYDSQLNSWWFHSNNANQFARWRPSSTPQLHAAQSGAATVDQCYVSGTTQDNGANFLVYWQGPWFTASGLYRHHAWNQPYVRKRVRQIRVDGHGVMDMYLAKDFAGGGTILLSNVFDLPTGTLFGGANSFGGIGIFGDVPSQSMGTAYSLGVARAFSVQFQSQSSSDMEVDSYTMFVQARTN